MRIGEDADGTSTAYEALSYCWRPSNAPKDLFWRGEACIKIGGNLSAALRRLRKTDKVRLLWIDAICINQEDIDERNAQFQIMCHIYNKAEQVIIRLGEYRRRYNGDMYVDAGFALAQKFLELQETHQIVNFRAMSFTDRSLTAVRHQPMVSPYVGCPRSSLCNKGDDIAWDERDDLVRLHEAGGV